MGAMQMRTMLVDSASFGKRVLVTGAQGWNPVSILTSWRQGALEKCSNEYRYAVYCRNRSWVSQCLDIDEDGRRMATLVEM